MSRAVHDDVPFFFAVRSEKAKPEAEKSKRVSTKKEIEDVYGKDSLDFLNLSPAKDGGGLPKNQYGNTEG